MVLTNTGAVKFSDIQSEFGGSGSIQMSEYYTGAGNIIANASGMRLIPSSGSSISVSQLRGRWKNNEPDRYPPTALSSDDTTLSGIAFGNGRYVCSTSYMYDTTRNKPYKAFDYNEGDWASGWSCTGRHNSTTGAYTGSTTTAATNGTSYAGEYFQIQFPLSLKICKWIFVPRNDWAFGTTNRMPYIYYIFGSNNGSTWNLVTFQDGQTYTTGSLVTVETYFSQAYSYWRIVVNTVGNPGEIYRDGADIAEFRCWWTT